MQDEKWNSSETGSLLGMEGCLNSEGWEPASSHQTQSHTWLRPSGKLNLLSGSLEDASLDECRHDDGPPYGKRPALGILSKRRGDGHPPKSWRWSGGGLGHHTLMWALFYNMFDSGFSLQFSTGCLFPAGHVCWASAREGASLELHLLPGLSLKAVW